MGATESSVAPRDPKSKKINKNSLRGKLSERKVGDVLELLRRWRYYYHHKNMTLKQAADQV